MISGFPHEFGPPNPEAVERMLGEGLTRWKALAAALEEAAGARGSWKSYGPKYGWRLDFRRKSGPLAGLYPTPEGPLLGINLVRKEWAPAFDLPLDPRAKAVLESSEPLKDGCFLLLLVADERTARDAGALIGLKADRR